MNNSNAHADSQQTTLWGHDVTVIRSVCNDPPAGKIDISRASSDSIRPITGKLQRRVLDFITGCGETGATDEELSEHFGWVYHGVAAITSRTLCRKHGLIVDSGIIRPNKSGALARVWILKANEGRGLQHVSQPINAVLSKHNLGDE